MQRSAQTYSTGKIGGTVGSPAITGVGTNWTTTDSNGVVSNNVAAYDELLVAAHRPLLILSVDGANALTISENLLFAIPAGSSYTIIKRTPSPANAVLSTLQAVLEQGSDSAPDAYRTVDNGVSRLRIGFTNTGKVVMAVGSTGGATMRTALLFDPATGNVTATGLGGSGGGSGNTILTVIGRPATLVGNPGDYAIDPTAKMIYGPKASDGSWPGGVSLVGPAADMTALSAAVAAAAASAAAARTSELNAAATLAGVVQKGTGIGQLGNAVKIGWSAAGALKATVDATDLGNIWTDYNGAKSRTVAGYEKLPSGLIIQWGTIQVTGDVSISFPTAFPSAILSLQASCSVGASPDALTCMVDYQSVASFAARLRRIINGGSVQSASITYGPTISWMAIGF